MPLAADLDGQILRTSICLEVSEQIHGSVKWWVESSTSAGRALANVLAAISKGDLDSLANSSDGSQVADRKSFEAQANAYFSQLAATPIESVSAEYHVDEFVIFVVNLTAPRGTMRSPLVFKRQDDNTFLFLPARSDATAFRLFWDWFEAPWRVNAGEASYCSDAEIKQATHRIPVGSSGSPAFAYLAGMPLNSNAQTPSARSIVQAVSAVRSAASRSVDAVASTMGPGSRDRLLEWTATLSAEDRAQFLNSLKGLQPLFAFHAGTLVVVYTLDEQRRPNVLYLQLDRAGTLKWVNLSRLSRLDRLFKTEPSYQQLSSVPPFQAFRIR